MACSCRSLTRKCETVAALIRPTLYMEIAVVWDHVPVSSTAIPEKIMERPYMETRRMALTLRQTPIRFVIALLGVAGALSLTGCGNFFQCEGKPACPSTGTPGTNSGDYAYISNNSSNADDLSVYDVSTGAPDPLSNSPISLGYIPNAMVINPAGTFMFVSNPATGVIESYSISSSGALSNGTTQVTQIVTAMAISSDGDYLYALDVTTEGSILAFYAIGANGSLTAASNPNTQLPISNTTTLGASIAVAPSGSNSNYLVVTLGTAGDVIVPLANDQLNTAIGFQTITFTTSGTGDYGAAIDTNNNVYFARTNSVAVYAVASNGSKGTLVGTTPTGQGDHAIVLTGNYLYTANSGDSTISGFSFTSGGVLTSLGAAYAAPTTVGALGIDNKKTYLVASGYNSTSGTMVYAIGSTGALTASKTTAATGTSTVTPVVIAMTP